MSLIRWNAKASFSDSDWMPFSLNQLLLRGCILKNTDWIYGVVAYTGHETKVVLNSKEAPSKVSNVMRKMNKMLYSVFVFQAIICLTFAASSIAWQKDEAENHNYLDLTAEPGADLYFIRALTFLVAYSHLIPISLYVALEVVKLALAYLIT
jgi:magnesium-transporting ATPase (P-type)